MHYKPLTMKVLVTKLPFILLPFAQIYRKDISPNISSGYPDITTSDTTNWQTNWQSMQQGPLTRPSCLFLCRRRKPKCESANTDVRNGSTSSVSKREDSQFKRIFPRHNEIPVLHYRHTTNRPAVPTCPPPTPNWKSRRRIVTSQPAMCS